MRGLETMQKRVALSLSVMLAMACTSVLRPAKASPSACNGIRLAKKAIRLTVRYFPKIWTTCS